MSDSSTSHDPLIGSRVGEYEITEVLGEGGMGVVYRGIQPVIKKRVAIKVLKPHIAQDEHQVKRLTIEAESVNAIAHRGIIDIFGMGQLPDGRPYIVMEYLDGEPLDVWMVRQPGSRVPVLTAIELLLEICAALSAAHRAGVIHRDLKPSNIFVCRQVDGTRFLKLLDFGLAKRALGLDGNAKQTSQATVSGTPDYMAPEQARGLPISPRSDVYALGVIAFELFTGRVPFLGATPMDVMVAHVGTPPPSPKTLEPSLPDELDLLVMRMLSKAPEARPQTVDEVRNALEDATVALGQPRPRSSREHRAYVPGPSPLPSAGSATPLPEALSITVEPPVTERPRRGLAVVIVAVVGVLGATAAAMLMRSDASPPLAHPGAEGVMPLVVDAGPAVAVAPAEPLEPTGGLQAAVDAAVAAEVLPVDAGMVVEETPPVEVPAPPKKQRPPATPRQLKDRIVKLEVRAKKKPNLDPTALQFLNRYKIDAAAADTAAKRAKVERTLNDWEKTFLRR